mgnify:CR=1 FL=1
MGHSVFCIQGAGAGRKPVERELQPQDGLQGHVQAGDHSYLIWTPNMYAKEFFIISSFNFLSDFTLCCGLLDYFFLLPPHIYISINV